MPGARVRKPTDNAPMHLHFLDPYRPGASLVHRLDQRVKLVLTLAYILTAALVPSGVWAAYILLFSFVLAVGILSELGVGFILKRSLLALPFVLAALPVIFTLDGSPLLVLPLGPWRLTASVEGLTRFLSITLKSWLSVQAAIITATSTSFPDLLLAMRAIRVPRLMVAIFGLMWRYLFVLADEALRLMRARAARSGETGRTDLKTGGSLSWRARITGGMAGSLFLRAFDRADRIYMAMLARGYDGEVRTRQMPALSPANRFVLLASLFFLVCLLGLSLLFA